MNVARVIWLGLEVELIWLVWFVGWMCRLSWRVSALYVFVLVLL